MAVRDSLRFIGTFARHPLRIGAVAPSSKFLARAMVRNLDPGPDDAIVEFGPGTGPFTAAIRDILPTPKNYLGIELDPGFHELLTDRFPDLRFVRGSAADAKALVDAAKLPRVKAILCGLPFPSIPMPVREQIVQQIDALLPPGGEFRTFTYVHCWYMTSAINHRQQMSDAFGPHHRSQPILCNIPPAYVLTWTKT